MAKCGEKSIDGGNRTLIAPTPIRNHRMDETSVQRGHERSIIVIASADGEN